MLLQIVVFLAYLGLCAYLIANNIVTGWPVWILVAIAISWIIAVFVPRPKGN